MIQFEFLNLIWQKADEYFEDFQVIFANQNRVVKPNVPLVVLTPGAVHRPYAPMIDWENDWGIYQCRVPVTVDLFTNGRPFYDNSGNLIAYGNDAVDELLGFVDFLNNQNQYMWMIKHNISILVSQDVQDATGVVNDSNYAYRSRCSLDCYFTHFAKEDIPPINCAEIWFDPSIQSDRPIHYPRFPRDGLKEFLEAKDNLDGVFEKNNENGNNCCCEKLEG